MADDEQFSLCWNNFNSNLSAGFHESLCRGDLVDVTLAAEGQFVKAHRLVLSVCSPYFRKMFTQMPPNQHAFVFLKDVSHSALKDLIQFMYCGEVNVKQDALPAFISTAEALQIKGLTDSDPAPSQSPAKPSTPAPQPAPPAQSLTSPRVRQRSSTSRSYRIETDDSDDKTTQIVLQATAAVQQQTQPTIVQQTNTTAAVVTQKRTAPRSISTPHTKRVKNSADPLEASEPTQIAVQTITESKSSSEPEFIELPIEIPTKSEPDYTEEAGEVETAEQETTYVEDDSYGDMKYDESYFTENDESGATAGGAGAATTSTAVVKQSFVDNSYVEQADQSASEAQVKNELIDSFQDMDVIRKSRTSTVADRLNISSAGSANASKVNPFEYCDTSMSLHPLENAETKNYKCVGCAELKKMATESHEETLSVLNRLTTEIVQLKDLVKGTRGDSQLDTCESSFPFSYNFPFLDKATFLEFENRCTSDEKLIPNLQKFFIRQGGEDAKSFLRKNLKKILTDEAALSFSWQGTETKQRVRTLAIISALKNAFCQQFPNTSDTFADNVIKQHFQHAKDRLAKRCKSKSI